MAEIESFNQLFGESKRNMLKLNSFHQYDDGTFACNFRVIDGARQFGPVAVHERPFDAMRDAYLAALKLIKAPVESVADDLFGDA